MAGQRTSSDYQFLLCMDDLIKEEQAINAKAEADSSTDSPTVSTKPQEVKEESVQPEKTETSTEGSKTEGDKKLTGAEKRIHALVDERDEYKAKVEDMSSRLAELTTETQDNADTPQFNQSPDTSGDRELTIDDLRTIARLEVEKEKTVNRIQSEGREAIRTYPVLDQSSSDFDADVNEAITSAVYLEIQKNPNQSVIKLTEKYMKPYLKAAENAVGKEKDELVKQVNDTVLRPSTIKGSDKKFHEKSLNEMEQELGIIY